MGAVTGNVAYGDSTDDARPVISGTGHSGETVIIYANGSELGRTTVAADGSWSFQPESPLMDGHHELTVAVIDAYGNTSAPGASFDIVIDTIAPASPTIESVIDDVGGYQGMLQNGDETDDYTPTFSGKAEAGSMVILYGNGQIIGSAAVDANGNWTFTPTTPLAMGEYDFTVAAMDAVGNLSDQSGAIHLILDGVVIPNFVEITQVVDDVGAVTGLVFFNGVTDDARPQINGTATPGDIINLYDGEVLLGSTVTDENGQWSFTPAVDLADGQHNFTAAAVDVAGNIGKPTDEFVVFVDTVAPESPTIESVIDNVGGYQGMLQNGDETDDYTPTFSGKAEAGGMVILYGNGQIIGSAAVDANGNWTFTPTTPLAMGEYDFTVAAMDAVGNLSDQSGAIHLILDGVVVLNFVEITHIIDDVGAVTGSLASNDVTDDARPQISGTATPGHVINIYDGEILLGSTVAAANGEWSFTPAMDLADGRHSFTAVAVDAAGNASTPTAEFVVTIDTVVTPNPEEPASPTIDLVQDDVGAVQGDLSSGSITDDNRPTLVGSANPGYIVNVYDGDMLLGSAVADAQGKWSFTPIALPDGPHSFYVTGTTSTGETSQPSPEFSLSIDTMPFMAFIDRVEDNVGAVTGNVVNGGATDDARPLISGTGQAGETVIIYANGSELGRTTVAADGSWSFQPESPLMDGHHDLTVAVIDAQGNTSAPGASFEIVIDTMAPVPVSDLVITDDVGIYQGVLQHGDVTDDYTPTFSGKAEAGNTVFIFANDQLMGSAGVDANGNWTFTPAMPLPMGDYDFTTVVEDPAGNRSEISEPVHLTLNSDVIQDFVEITQVIDDVGMVTGSVPHNGVTDDARPQVSGIGSAGQQVIVYAIAHEGMREIGRATVDADGKWSLKSNIALAEGRNELIADLMDSDGNLLLVSSVYAITVDITAPMPVTDLVITDNVGDYQGVLKNGDNTDDYQPTFSGKAEAGNTVFIFANDQLMGSVRVDANGDWTFTPAMPLPMGDYQFTTMVADQAGNRSEISEPVHLILDGVVIPNFVEITEAIDNVGMITGSLASNDITDDARPQIAGNAMPGDIINIYDSKILLGSTAASESGYWSFIPTVDLADGQHSFTAAVVNAAGNVGKPSAEFVVIIDTVAPASPIIESVIDNVGSYQGILKNGDVTDDATPTFTGKGEAGNIIVIYANDQMIATALVNAGGNWTFTPATPLPLGEYHFTVAAIDPAGNQSAQSGSINLIIDNSGTPPVIQITQLIDDVGSVTGELAANSVTDDARPQIMGVAMAGNVVKIYDGEIEIGSTIANESGQWSFTPAFNLADGEHRLTASEVDVVGNYSPRSPEFVFTVDTIPSATPTIESVSADFRGDLTSGTAINNGTPTLKGTAEQGSVVNIFDNGILLGSTIADSDGKWSFTPTAELSEGEHAFTVAGNTGSPSGEFTVIVDYDLHIHPPVPEEPSVPTIDVVINDAQEVVSNGGVSDDFTPTLLGKGELGDIIHVYDRGVLLGSAVVNDDYNWSFTPELPLSDGNHVFFVTATNAAEVVSQQSADYVVILDYPVSYPDLAITEVLDQVGAITGNLSIGDITDDPRPVIKGTGTAGDMVIVYTTGQHELGRTMVDADGLWSLRPVNPLPEGDNALTAVGVNADGEMTMPTPSFTINISCGMPLFPALIESVLDDVGAIQGMLQKGDITDDNLPTLKGVANSGNIVSLYDHDVLIGSTQADASGKWSFTPIYSLADGEHKITVTATDTLHGRVSEPSGVYNFTVDTTADVGEGVMAVALGDVLRVGSDELTFTADSEKQSSLQTENVAVAQNHYQSEGSSYNVWTMGASTVEVPVENVVNPVIL
ncbi:Ig-like domain-containing protein [Limnobaculum xujianqingii]|uniref:Ig-like domain-containing protein n=1 Tax=Limnobaculum xujianqingii TaxID=2738837 RepID=UPI0015E82438|nr:Ig-like domain-containing protein [Limnobaculum xujianqingii]